jgi:hypothetical protein
VLVGVTLAGWLAVRYAMSGELPGPAAFLQRFTALDWWTLFFHWFVDGNALWDAKSSAATADLWSRAGLLAFEGGFALLLLLGLWPGRGTAARAAAGELALLVCALPLAVYALSFSGRNLYIERYMLVSLPFFAIAIARGATRFSRGYVRAAVICLVIGVEAASYAALVEKDEQNTVYKPNPDWRAAAAFLASHHSGPERLLIVGGVPLTDFFFYLSRQWPPPLPRVRSYTDEEVERFRRDGGAFHVVLVRNRFWWGDRDIRLLEELRGNPDLQSASMASFKGVDLFTFAPRER